MVKASKARFDEPWGMLCLFWAGGSPHTAYGKTVTRKLIVERGPQPALLAPINNPELPEPKPTPEPTEKAPHEYHAQSQLLLGYLILVSVFAGRSRKRVKSDRSWIGSVTTIERGLSDGKDECTPAIRNSAADGYPERVRIAALELHTSNRNPHCAIARSS
jgi:hypothetical protein